MSEEIRKPKESDIDREVRFAQEERRHLELSYDAHVVQNLNTVAQHFSVDRALQKAAGGKLYVIKLHEPFKFRMFVAPSKAELGALESVVERLQEHDSYRFIQDMCRSAHLTASLEMTSETGWPFAAIVITPEKRRA